MNDWDEELRKSLARKEPSPGFTARVLAKARQETLPERRWWQTGWSRAWLAPVTAAVIAVAVAGAYRQHVRNEEGMLAKEKLIYALRLTGNQLQETQKRVMQSGAYRGKSNDNPAKE